MPSVCGSQIDSAGQYVTITRNTSIGNSHGHTANVSSVMIILVMPDATYRLRPTGGWQRPTSMLTTIMMPKCTGSMPSFIATGTRIGAMISTIDEGSITLPAISNSTFTIIRNAIGPSPLSSSHAAICCGMFSEVIRKENSTALVMM